MERREREYGKGGWIGIGTPQANPTVEAEFRRLLPDDAEMLITRLQGSATSSEQRLKDYLVGLDGALGAYDALKPDVFGFACTGSSYLVGAAREAKIVAAASARFGYPVITAAQAVLASLQALSASRIAVLAPYPQNIIDASVAFWEQAGLTVTAAQRIDIGSADTRRIYGLSSKDAALALADLPTADADAVLLSGTGMPTLSAIRDLGPGMGKPLLSSNYCLAWAVLRELGDRREPWGVQGATLSAG
jgi:maleate isomerase